MRHPFSWSMLLERLEGDHKMTAANEKQTPRVPRYEAGVPGSIGKQGEIEEAHGNVWPVSGPFPPDHAEIQPMASWGQGLRGAAGYDDTAPSEIMRPERFQSEPAPAEPHPENDRTVPDEKQEKR
jgi:hypothetical protein